MEVRNFFEVAHTSIKHITMEGAEFIIQYIIL